MENFLYAKSIWKYLISVLHISSFQLEPSIPSNECIKVSVVAHDISNFDLCHLFHPRDPSIICMHMKSQRFSTVSAHYSICGGTAVSRWKLKAFPPLLFPQCFINVNSRIIESFRKLSLYILSNCAYDFTRLPFLALFFCENNRPVYEAMVHIFWFNCWANGGDFV